MVIYIFVLKNTTLSCSGHMILIVFIFYWSYIRVTVLLPVLQYIKRIVSNEIMAWFFTSHFFDEDHKKGTLFTQYIPDSQKNIPVLYTPSHLYVNYLLLLLCNFCYGCHYYRLLKLCCFSGENHRLFSRVGKIT